MLSALFLQSAVQDPYDFYTSMLANNPVYWDEANQLWAIYSYESCQSVLANTVAHIPPVNKEGLNEYALLITANLARLNNNAEHFLARELAMLLFRKIKTISIKEIAGPLLKAAMAGKKMDWVSTIAKQVPVMAILKGFDFTDADAGFICSKMASFAMIPAAVKTTEQVTRINESAKAIYPVVERHLLATGMFISITQSLPEEYAADPDMLLSACISNLSGLFIQAYDAGRGILSNTLVQLLAGENAVNPGLINHAFLQKAVIETLRYDSPVQNTRRVAAENMQVTGIEIKQGASILVVLAAANRDPQQFIHPGIFDTARTNNSEHLGFGYGGHQCVANHFSVYLATETLFCFFEQYKNIKLLEQAIQYEPAINVRLPVKILLSLE